MSTATDKAKTPASECRRLTTLAAVLLATALGLLVVTPSVLAESPAPRIIGGAVAPTGSWPSQAALLSPQGVDPQEDQFCGGTLIDPSWVLTAAHCVFWPKDHPRAGQQLQPSDIEVAIGILRKSDIAPTDRIQVAEIRVHPDWRPRTVRWDVALLRLATPSSQQVMSMIQPSQLSATAGGRPAEIAGWGCTGTSNQSCLPGAYPDSLLQVRTSFISDSDCSKLWTGSFDPGTMICAGSITAGNRRACSGDSGGPLTASVGGRPVLAGVVSFGSGGKVSLCDAPNLPSVFARVASARGWVDRQLGRSANLTRVSLKPAKKKVKAGKKVSLRVTVTNVGDAATNATVKLSVNNRKKAKIPGSVKVPVDAGGSATGAITVTTVSGKSGKVTVKATLGPLVAKSAITLIR